MNQPDLFQMPEPEPVKLMPELLLHPNIPKPLHGINPRTIKGKSWWDRNRKHTYAEREFTCWACGVHKTDAKFHKWLEAHEIYEFDYDLGRVTFVRLCALCHACHNYIHDGRMQMLVAMGRMTADKQARVLAHGERVLRAAGSGRFRPDYPDGPETPWGEWHMLIEGVKYYSCFSGYREWNEYYAVYNGKGPLTPRLQPFVASDECPGAVLRSTALRPAPIPKPDFGTRRPLTINRSTLSRALDRIAAKHHDLDPDIDLDIF